MPLQYSLQVYRGDTYSWQFTLWQDAAKTIPFDLTNVTAKAEIRNRPGGATVVALALTVTLPNVIVAALDAASSAQLPIPGVWDLQLTDAAGDVSTVLAGGVYVTADVTDSLVTVAPLPIRLAA